MFPMRLRCDDCWVLALFAIGIPPASYSSETAPSSPQIHKAHPIAMADTRGVLDRGRLTPLTSRQSARRFVVGQGMVEGGTAGGGEEVIYRNATGPEVYLLMPNERVADDLSTICGHSELTRIAVQVTGGGDGSGPGFDIEVELYNGCPSQNGVPISGTHFAVNLPDDGLFTVESDLSNTPVPIGREVWLAIRSSSNHAGWVFGGEPDVGSSQDFVETDLFGCSTNFGGCPPQGPACANGAATLYAINCEPEFVAYRADAFSGYFVGMELSDLFADDIVPTTSYTDQLCDVLSYEPLYMGLNGPYGLVTEIWSKDPMEFSPLAPVPGTQCGDGVPCVFNPPVQIPTTEFFVAYDLVFGDNAGPVLVGDYPSVGTSGDIFCIAGDPQEPWSCVWFFGGCGPGTDNPCATFMNKIICAGVEPAGACCILDPENDFHCLNDVPVSQCIGRFSLGGSCEEQPFDPPCGTAACCDFQEECANVTEVECEAVHGYWQPGLFCPVDNDVCPPSACLSASNDCYEESLENPGCNNIPCCQHVCSIDSFCCEAAWDSTCVQIAKDFGCEELIIHDECIDAVVVSCGESVILDNTLATDRLSDPGFSCHGAGEGQNGVGSVWARFFAESPTARLRTCDSEGNADDSLLAVYSGSCSNLTEIACNDDTIGCADTDFNSEICVSNLNPGQWYYVQLASWTVSDLGRYTLEIECPAVSACPLEQPLNDDCENAEFVQSGFYPFTNHGATTDGDPVMPLACGECFGACFVNDIWYRFVSPDHVLATVELCDQTNFDTVISVFADCQCGHSSNEAIACNDDGCGFPVEIGGPSRVSFEAQAGACYSIRVGGLLGATGSGLMVISLIPVEGGCPEGNVSFLNPPTGVVDARQPHPANQPMPTQGIKTFAVSAPTGADHGCFQLCETVGLPSPNSIVSVTENGPGAYTITLARPITPHAITRIAYQPGSSPASIGTFISHPGNVNGDGYSNPIDILAIIDCLNGVNVSTNCPWGLYSMDIDHSGIFNPADILREIDLLNGVYECPFVNCPEPGPNPLPMGTCTP